MTDFEPIGGFPPLKPKGRAITLKDVSIRAKASSNIASYSEIMKNLTKRKANIKQNQSKLFDIEQEDTTPFDDDISLDINKINDNINLENMDEDIIFENKIRNKLLNAEGNIDNKKNNKKNNKKGTKENDNTDDLIEENKSNDSMSDFTSSSEDDNDDQEEEMFEDKTKKTSVKKNKK